MVGTTAVRRHTVASAGSSARVMTHAGTLAAAAVVTAALLSGSAIASIGRPLHAVLWELCALEHRARFWERTCWLALVLGVALAGSVALPVAVRSRELTDALAFLARCEVAGALIGIAVIGTVVLRESQRFARQGPPSCRDD